jgi:nitrogen regulatory protein P-II 1
MKSIEAIIRPEKLTDLLDEFNKHKVLGVTVTQVMGCGLQGGRTQYYRGNKYTINLLPKVKVEIVSIDSRVEEITDIIINAVKTGEIGDGKIFIYDIEDCLRIRTGEKGEPALV